MPSSTRIVRTSNAAVGMIVQKALVARNLNDIGENKYVQMGYVAANLNLQSIWLQRQQ